MTVETAIRQSLDYASAAGWDPSKQTELAVGVVCRLRPDWSSAQALSAVDWVRSLAPGDLPRC